MVKANVSADRARCEVCAAPLNYSNVTGICSGPNATAECRRVRRQRTARANGVPPRVRNTCAHPDGCPEPAHAHGYCSLHRTRLARTGELGPVGRINEPRAIAVGDTFGQWTAAEAYAGRRDLSRADYRILCRCTCGTERRVLIATLKNGSSSSCGCTAPGIAAARRRARGPYLRPGEVYGRLTVLEPADIGDSLVRCLCECGNEVSPRADGVKHGGTKSCGCSRQTHGLSRHPLWPTWTGMIARTSRPGHTDYERYGGRGITVCMRWQGKPEGFLNFIADVGERPRGCTLDREDNDGNYEPGNVAWKTPKQQSANQRTVRKLAARVAELEAEVAALRAELASERGALF